MMTPILYFNSDDSFADLQSLEPRFLDLLNSNLFVFENPEPGDDFSMACMPSTHGAFVGVVDSGSFTLPYTMESCQSICVRRSCSCSPPSRRFRCSLTMVKNQSLIRDQYRTCHRGGEAGSAVIRGHRMSAGSSKYSPARSVIFCQFHAGDVHFSDNTASAGGRRCRCPSEDQRGIGIVGERRRSWGPCRSTYLSVLCLSS